MTATDCLTSEQMEFLAKCEDELKDRFTEKDEQFMKVFNAEPSVPPIMESWWVPNNNRRNDRRNNRRYVPYERQGGGSEGYRRRGNYDRRDDQYSNRRGYNDRGYDDHGHPGYNQRRY